MNFVAHVEVAVAATPAHGPVGSSSRLAPVLVGAALPDLAGIGRFRLESRKATGDLAAGIQLHHDTDTVFHVDGRFQALMAELRNALAAAGMARGPARACGHVGVELLLDGHLLRDPSVVQRATALLAVAASPGEEVLDLVARPRRDQWEEHLAVVADRIDPAAYADPDRVAARLHRILSRRPALALDQDHLEVLASELHTIQPSVNAVAESLVFDTAAAVAPAA